MEKICIDTLIMFSSKYIVAILKLEHKIVTKHKKREQNYDNLQRRQMQLWHPDRQSRCAEPSTEVYGCVCIAYLRRSNHTGNPCSADL